MSLSDLLGIVGITISSVAFFIGLFQYREGQRWKALEFVSNEIKEFFSHRDVVNVLKMLDVNRRPIEFHDAATNKYQKISVSDELIISAFRTPEMRKGADITPTDGLIRDTFRSFFDYLARFSNYIEASGLIQYRDLHPFLGHWLAILCDEKYARKSPDFIAAVKTYLEYYHYRSVLTLFEHYRKWVKHYRQSPSR
jgi:hypothetical protein